MKTKSIIIKVSLYYILFFVIFSISYAIIYYATKTGNESFLKYMFFSFAVSAGHSLPGINDSGDFFNIAQIVHKFIIGISFPVFTSFIFYYLINRQPEIVFPDKLLIRRTSDGCLVLSILLGNKDYERSGYYLYDVECKIKYSFAVDRINRYRRNAKTQLTSFTSVFIGFYRFSFSLSEFPACFINSILSQDDISLMDTVMFTVSGKFGPWNSGFIVSKTYDLSTIYLASNNEEIYKEIDNGGKIKEIFTWKNMNNLIHYKHSEELHIRHEMKSLLSKY